MKADPGRVGQVTWKGTLMPRAKTHASVKKLRWPLIGLGSGSSLKYRGTSQAIQLHYFQKYQLVGQKVPTGISDNPVGFEQMEIGAENRAIAIKRLLNPDVAIGIEGGLVRVNGYWFTSCVVVVIDRDGNRGVSLGGGLSIPQEVAQHVIDEGISLGDHVKPYVGMKDPHAYFSEGRIAREVSISLAVAKALAVLVHSTHPLMMEQKERRNIVSVKKIKR